MSLIRQLYVIASLVTILTAASFASKGSVKAATPLQTVVVNTSSNPVPVKTQGTSLVQDAGVLARTPVSAVADASIPFDDFRASAPIYTVPDGKRLVVTQVFGQAILGQDEKLTMAKFGGYPLDFTDHGNGVMFQGPSKTIKSFASLSTPANFVFNPGDNINVFAQRNVDTSGYFTDVVIGFSGYLEPAN